MRGSEHPYTGQRSLVDAEWQRVYDIYVYIGLAAVVHRKEGHLATRCGTVQCPGTQNGNDVRPMPVYISLGPFHQLIDVKR